MTPEIAIKVSNLSKVYHIYDNPRHRLQQMLKPILGKLHSRFDRTYFSEFYALQDINFEIKTGDSLGVIGRNGAGKSTLLQLIAGVLNPSQGEVIVNGRVNALLELGSGFNPEFSGRENVYINGSILGFSKAQIDQKFQEIWDFSEIGTFIDQPVKTYSSGMFVRLAFSVQALLSPEILIVDEALSVGDIFFQNKCLKIINSLLNEGKTTFLFVSHDIHSVIRYCKKSILLNKGKILYYGDSVIAGNLFYLLEKKSDEWIIEEGIRIDAENNSESQKINNILPETSKLLSANKLRFISGSFERVELLGYSIADSKSSETVSDFFVADTLTFRFKFLAKKYLEVPLIALGINSVSDLSIFGKYNFQYGMKDIPLYMNPGDELELTYNVKMDMLPGNYLFAITFNEMFAQNFKALESFSNERFSESLNPVFTIAIDSFSLRVAPDSLFLPFNGLVDLPSRLETKYSKNK